jgi:RsiW-degrading membrane proteinase PrsW (M82 family)
MLILYSALAAIIPIVLYLIFIWKFDRFDREPIGLYLKNFLWGAFGAVFFALIGNLLFTYLLSLFIADKSIVNSGSSIFIAPIVEEFTKGVFLLFTVTNRKFDNITDGIVYGGAIGLGFGMTENFLYFSSVQDSMRSWLLLVTIRTIYTAGLHCVTTATFGAFLGLAKFKSLFYKIVLPPIGLGIAIFLHSFWNLTVSSSETSLIGFIFLSGLIILFVSLFSLSISKEKKMIFEELLFEANTGLIPHEHVSILSSDERENKGWINENIRNIYIKSATKLAFRKMQLRNSTGYNKSFYASEVDQLRSYIAELVKNF